MRVLLSSEVFIVHSRKYFTALFFILSSAETTVDEQKPGLERCECLSSDEQLFQFLWQSSADRNKPEANSFYAWDAVSYGKCAPVLSLFDHGSKYRSKKIAKRRKKNFSFCEKLRKQLRNCDFFFLIAKTIAKLRFFFQNCEKNAKEPLFDDFQIQFSSSELSNSWSIKKWWIWEKLNPAKSLWGVIINQGQSINNPFRWFPSRLIRPFSSLKPQ